MQSIQKTSIWEVFSVLYNGEYTQEIPQSQLQTNPWHREEEPHNDNETPGRQTKQSNQLSQDDCKTRIDMK